MTELSSVPQAISNFNPFDPAELVSPHAGWKALRQSSPVHRIEIDGLEQPVFLVTRKREIKQVAEQPDLFSSSDRAIAPIFRWGNFEPDLLERFHSQGLHPVHSLVTSDPPNAQRFRAVAEGFFNKRNVDRLDPVIDDIVKSLVERLPQGEAFNFVDHFSMPLPLQVICLILGLPYSDAEMLRTYTDEFTHLVDPAHGRDRALEALETVIPGYRYLADRIKASRREPRHDLMSAYANARHSDGQLFDLDEAVSMAHVTVIGGNETTRNAISTAALVLAQRNDIWSALQQNRHLVPKFVEEMIRYGAPSAAMPRAVMRDTELGGIALPKGACLFLLWGSGSRDETVFDEPERIDLSRPNIRAHTSFGLGLHHCAGSMLARREMVLAVSCWLDCLSSLELAVPADEISYLPSFAFRALGELPMIAKRK